jgi:hypothetical protein
LTQDSLRYSDGEYVFKSIPVISLSKKHKVDPKIVRKYRDFVRSLFFVSNEELDTEGRKKDYDALVRVTLAKTKQGISPKGLLNQIRFFKATDTQLIVKPDNVVGKNLTYNDAYRYLYQLMTTAERPFVYTYNLKKFFKADGIKDVIKHFTGIELTTKRKDTNYNLYLNNHLEIV